MRKIPKLYQFQKEGIAWLKANPRAYLADKPGLGKTVQAVVAATELGVGSPYVICPAIAESVWLAHWQEWGDRSVTPRTVSYERLASSPKVYQEILAEADIVICDEWHYAKNPLAKRTKAACRLISQMPNVWLISATPIPNNPSEIYTSLRALWPHLLQELGVSTYRSFIFKFCISRPVRYGPGRMGTQIIGAQNSKELRAVLQKIMLVRELSDVDLQLPPLRWENTRLELVGDEWDILTDRLKPLMTPELVKLIHQRIRVDKPLPDTALATVRRTFGVAKSFPAARLLSEELRDGKYDKIVVVAFHIDVLDVLEAELKQFGLVRTDGSTTPPTRTSNINAFQNDPSVRVYLGQYSTTGVSITLHAARELVMVEQPWGPGEIEQIARRIHRIGQEGSCRVRMFIVPDTIDDAVARVRARKLRMIGEVVTT